MICKKLQTRISLSPREHLTSITYWVLDKIKTLIKERVKRMNKNEGRYM